MSEEQKNEQLIIGFLIATSISTITALILHPRSGKKTRQILKKTAQALPQIAQDVSSSLETHSNHLSKKIQQKWQKTSRRLQIAIKAGISASKQ